jgi:hypothetical protein
MLSKEMQVMAFQNKVSFSEVLNSWYYGLCRPALYVRINLDKTDNT